ncbi:hypothetical protein V1478_014403 [Vespula squamosa]|uniref:Uncharacterized protein n=1 Tax=Vespula squamosa TaxID=30214 RepID=A0ABD2A864_VESSQ
MSRIGDSLRVREEQATGWDQLPPVVIVCQTHATTQAPVGGNSQEPEDSSYENVVKSGSMVKEMKINECKIY